MSRGLVVPPDAPSLDRLFTERGKWDLEVEAAVRCLLAAFDAAVDEPYLCSLARLGAGRGAGIRWLVSFDGPHTAHSVVTVRALCSWIDEAGTHAEWFVLGTAFYTQTTARIRSAARYLGWEVETG